MLTLGALYLDDDGLAVELIERDGSRRRVDVRTIDQPRLESLPDLDRGRIRSALMTLHRQGEHHACT
jgi:hypothetical protein